MKKISLLIILAIIINISVKPVFGKEVSTLSKKIGYELYQERVTNHCNQYKLTDNSSELIYIINDDMYENYDAGYTDDSKKTYVGSVGSLDSLNDLKKAKKQYRKVMDGIYDCANSVVYYKAYNLVIEDLISKSGPINSALKSELTKKKEKIETYQESLNGNSKNSCKLTSSNNNSIIKKSVLKQTTYELCRYSYYLEYLKERNNNLAALDVNFDTRYDKDSYNKEKVDDANKDSYLRNPDNAKTINTIIDLQTNKINEINYEAENTFKVFPLAFQAYSDFENNVSIHILLELLREAYDLLREELHKSINPINQVVYKISNAMKN